MRSHAKDLSGKVFECLTVVSRAPNDGRYSAWNCVCVCGRKLNIRGVSLSCGNTKSCSRCFRRLYEPGTTRGREYVAYRSAKGRCTNPNDKDYPRYGGSGVKFLFRNFTEWYEELGPSPSPRHTVDRIGNGNYAAGRVRWATPAEQAWHRRKTRRKTSSRYKGVTRKLNRWQSVITRYGKAHYLGWFPCEEDAALAYDKKARELFGKFAFCNFREQDASA